MQPIFTNYPIWCKDMSVCECSKHVIHNILCSIEICSVLGICVHSLLHWACLVVNCLIGYTKEKILHSNYDNCLEFVSGYCLQFCAYSRRKYGCQTSRHNPLSTWLDGPTAWHINKWATLHDPCRERMGMAWHGL